MATFLITAAVIMLTLGLVSYISGKRVDHPSSGATYAVSAARRHQIRKPEREFPLLLPHHDVDRHQHRSDSGALALLLGTSFNLGAGAERLCDVAQGSLLGVADLHASNTEETTF